MMAFERAAPRGGQQWLGSVMMVAGALSVALVSYSISLKVSSERKAAERVVRENRALAADLDRLGAELRVRMRLPQLERWNANVLGLQPIAAEQFLADPLMLANYGVQPDPAAQQPTLAVARNLETPAPADTGAAALTRVVAQQPSASAAVPASRPEQPAARTVAVAQPPAPSGIDPALIAVVEAMAADARQQPRLSTVALDGGDSPPPRSQ